ESQRRALSATAPSRCVRWLRTARLALEQGTAMRRCPARSRHPLWHPASHPILMVFDTQALPQRIVEFLECAAETDVQDIARPRQIDTLLQRDGGGPARADENAIRQ